MTQTNLPAFNGALKMRELLANSSSRLGKGTALDAPRKRKDPFCCPTRKELVCASVRCGEPRVGLLMSGKIPYSGSFELTVICSQVLQSTEKAFGMEVLPLVSLQIGPVT